VYRDSGRETWTDVEISSEMTSAEVIQLCLSQQSDHLSNQRSFLSEMCMGYGESLAHLTIDLIYFSIM